MVFDGMNLIASAWTKNNPSHQLAIIGIHHIGDPFVVDRTLKGCV